MFEKFKVIWHDTGRKPECPADPRYPQGIDLDLAEGAAGCVAELLCPAPQCGLYFVECQLCGANALVTTAGRKDDPRSVKLPCCRRMLQ